MATSLGSLVVSLGLDAAEYTRGLDKAQRDAQKARDEMARVFSQAGALIGAGAAAGAIGLVALTKSSIDAADHLLDLSKATGITVETLGGIGFAASQAGSDLDGTASALGKLNLSIAKAAAGDKEAAAAFQLMGVSIKDASGNARSADAVFADVAAKFGTYADGPEASALANALFGKSYQSLLPLLKDGGQALQANIAYYQQFGGVTTDTARQADEFNDTLGKIGFQTSLLGRTLAAELLKPLQAVADEILRFQESDEGFKSLAAGVRVALENVVLFGANVIFVFQQLGQTFAAYAAVVNRVLHLDFAGATTVGEVYRAQAVDARLELDKLERRILQLDKLSPRDLLRRQEASTGDGAAKRAAPSLAGSTIKAQQEQTSEAQRYLDALTKQIDETYKLTQAEKALIETAGGLKGLTPALQEQILARAEQIDASKRLESQLKAEAEQVKAFAAEQNALAAEGARVFEATRTPVEVLGTEIDRLNKLLQQGAIDWDTYGRAQFLAQDKFDESIAKTKKGFEEMDSFQKKLADGVQQTLGDGLANALEGNFKGIEQSFISMINRLIAQAIAADLARSLFGGDAKGGTGSGLVGQAGDFIKGLFGGDAKGGAGAGAGLVGQAGDFLKDMFAGAFAGGGFIPPGQWGMTGERGPEPVFGGRTGVTVQPARGGGSRTVMFNQNINVQGAVDTRTRLQMAAEAQVVLARSRRNL